ARFHQPVDRDAAGAGQPRMTASVTAPVTATGAGRSAAATYRRLLGHARRYWPYGLLAMIGMLFDAAAAGAFTWLLKPMLDNLFVARDEFAIRWLPVGLILLFLLRGAATYATDYGMARIGRSMVRDLRSKVFAQYQRLPAAWFDREASGELIARVIYSAEQVAHASSDA